MPAASGFEGRSAPRGGAFVRSVSGTLFDGSIETDDGGRQALMREPEAAGFVCELTGHGDRTHRAPPRFDQGRGAVMAKGVTS